MFVIVLIGISMAHCKTPFKLESYSKAQSRWQGASTCSLAIILLPSCNTGKTDIIFEFDRDQIGTVTSLITGRFLIVTLAMRLGMDYNNYCRRCKNEENVETMFHILYQ